MITRPVQNPNPLNPKSSFVRPTIVAFYGGADDCKAAILALQTACAEAINAYGSPSACVASIPLDLRTCAKDLLTLARLRAVDAPPEDSPAFQRAFERLLLALDELAPLAVARNAASVAVGLRTQHRDVYVYGFRTLAELREFRNLTGALTIGLQCVSEEIDVVISSREAFTSSAYMQGLARSGAFADLAASTGAIAAPIATLRNLRKV